MTDACKHCDADPEVHPCWKHSKTLGLACRAEQKWAPSKCRECIFALAAMSHGSPAEKRKAKKDYDGLLRGVVACISRVSSTRSLISPSQYRIHIIILGHDITGVSISRGRHNSILIIPLYLSLFSLGTERSRGRILLLAPGLTRSFIDHNVTAVSSAGSIRL